MIILGLRISNSLNFKLLAEFLFNILSSKKRMLDNSRQYIKIQGKKWISFFKNVKYGLDLEHTVYNQSLSD